MQYPPAVFQVHGLLAKVRNRWMVHSAIFYEILSGEFFGGILFHDGLRLINGCPKINKIQLQ